MSVSSVSNSNLALASQAEKEAVERIKNAEQRVIEGQKEADSRLSHVEQESDQRIQAEITRSENLVESERSKGYERIRDLQRSQQAELRRLRKDGDAELAMMQEHYRRNIQHAGAAGEQEIKDIQSQHNRRLDYERVKNENETEDFRANREHALGVLRDNFQEEREHLSRNNKQDYERLKGEYEAAAEKYRQNFEGFYRMAVHRNEDSINNLNENAGRKLQSLQRDTAEKMSTYESRLSDPFYRLLDLNAQISDEGDHYVLTADIPRHEQGHLSATIQGDRLVISGYRSNQVESEPEPGHKRGTASFQSFHESFPLDWPVEAKKLSRENQENQVIFRVPKKGPYARQTISHKAAAPEKIRASRPQFPSNIHLPEDRPLRPEASDSSDSAGESSSSKRKTSTTPDAGSGMLG